MSIKVKSKNETTNDAKHNIHSSLSVYEYIWKKAFPNEEFNFADFSYWSKKNANYALSLALEYCDLNGG